MNRNEHDRPAVTGPVANDEATRWALRSGALAMMRRAATLLNNMQDEQFTERERTVLAAQYLRDAALLVGMVKA